MSYLVRRFSLVSIIMGLVMWIGCESTPADIGDGAIPMDDARTVDAAPIPVDVGPYDGGSISGVTVHIEEATPEQIGLHLILGRAFSDESTGTVRYRAVTETEWRTGHPLLRIKPDWNEEGAPEAPVDAFAGTIFDLRPGETYEVEITLDEPGQPSQVVRTVTRTRALPGNAPAPTVTATTSDDLQAKLDSLGPGDVLELANGTYEVEGLHLASSGTESEPMYIRGASREGVVIRDMTGNVLQIQEASHVVIENLTIRGSGVDSGTDASSRGIAFWDGATQEYITIRSVDIVEVDQGIVSPGPVRGVLVYDNALHGNNVWTMEFIESNRTWNDEGVQVAGEGNCVFENTIHGFGDALSWKSGVHAAANYVYRNRITMTGDDAFEADYATRNIGIYDNYITNSATFLSLDPLWGGPLYCFRNVVINNFRGPFKLNATNSGFLIYSNTIVRTEGKTGWGWVQFNNGALRSWSYRNNILLYHGGTGNLLAVEATGNSPIDVTHNAWYPDGSIWWTSTGGSFTSLDGARASLPATPPLFGTSSSRHEHDLISEANPFVSPITLGADHLTEIMSEAVPTLSSTANAKNSGVEIPNITDGYSGSAPDMGAIIEGRSVPRWGAVRP
jgi:hypothetical protein